MWRLGTKIAALLLVVAFVIAGCGGGGISGSTPQQDFSLLVSPSSISAIAGTIGPPAIISVTGQNGFVGSVTIAVNGLPPGAIVSPSSPFTVRVPGSQQVTIFFPPTLPTGPASVQFDATAGSLSHRGNLQLLVAPVSGTAVLQDVPGQVVAGTIEIQGLSAGNFNPGYWQKDTLNWVPDVRKPVLAPLPGVWQNIYSPWPLEQANGWRLFYGGWDGTSTPNDRVYSGTTSDFLTFHDRALVIDHGAFEHVNNVNVRQLADGSLHMICTVLMEPEDLDKPAYFSSPDGASWNGTAAPYSAQRSDVVSIPDDPNYLGWDFNGGNVLIWDANAWTLYYSVGIYGNIGKVFRAASDAPPVFQMTGSSLKTHHYANDVGKFQAGGRNWYVMLLYIEEATFGTVRAPVFSYSLSNDGVSFGPEQALFGGAYPEDEFPITPAFVTRGDQILGVLYGANAVDLLNAQDQIFAQWLQKKVVITDSSGTQYLAQGGYGPDRQWFQGPPSGTLEGTMVVYAEDGVTVLGSALVTLTSGNVYTLVLK